MKNTISQKWSGLFSKDISEKMKAFNSSISFDFKLIKHDIIGTMAHVKMLQKINILTTKELESTLVACENLLNRHKDGSLEVDFEAEDVHFFIQEELKKEIGDLAKKIHTGRSRNDQIALDMRLYCREHLQNITTLTGSLIDIMSKIASENKQTLMPAYTHLQQAQPTSLGHYFYCYAEMLSEDLDRMKSFFSRLNKSPLGSASVCGSCLPLERSFTAQEMNFAGLVVNSMNGVSNRDFIIEFCSITSILMMHLSRFCEDVIIYSSKEFGFFILDDAFCTGSSLMPNKKNPDLPELIRGKAGRAIGNLMSIFSIMKNLPMAYNKDMQEDKKSLFENAEISTQCLDILVDFTASLSFNKQKMEEQVLNSYCLATDVLDYLILKGVYFKDAHETIAKLIKFATEKGKWLQKLSLEEFREFSDFFEADVFEIFKKENILTNHKTIGGSNLEVFSQEAN